MLGKILDGFFKSFAHLLILVIHHTVYILPRRPTNSGHFATTFFNRQGLLHNEFETQLKKELAIMMWFHRHSGQMLRPDFLFPNDSGG